MKALLAGVAALLLTTTMALAEEDCRVQIDRAQQHLTHMMQRLGPGSDAVRLARFDLEQIRAACAGQNRNQQNSTPAGHNWDGDRRGPH